MHLTLIFIPFFDEPPTAVMYGRLLITVMSHFLVYISCLAALS